MADKPTGEELTQLWSIWEPTLRVLGFFGGIIAVVIAAVKKLMDYQNTTRENHLVLVSQIAVMQTAIEGLQKSNERILNKLDMA